MLPDHVESLMREGNWEQAKAECLRLRQEHPENPKIGAYLGLCHHHFGEIEEAIRELKRAMVLDPHYWEPGLKLVKILDKLRRYEEALEVARDVEKLRPSDPELQALIRGLERQVPDKITDNWEISRRPPHYNVELTRDE